MLDFSMLLAYGTSPMLADAHVGGGAAKPATNPAQTAPAPKQERKPFDVNNFPLTKCGCQLLPHAVSRPVHNCSEQCLRGLGRCLPRCLLTKLCTPRRERVLSFMQDGYIMVTWSNHHYLDFARSWSHQVKKVGAACKYWALRGAAWGKGTEF